MTTTLQMSRGKGEGAIAVKAWPEIPENAALKRRRLTMISGNMEGRVVWEGSQPLPECWAADSVWERPCTGTVLCHSTGNTAVHTDICACFYAVKYREHRRNIYENHNNISETSHCSPSKVWIIQKQQWKQKYFLSLVCLHISQGSSIATAASWFSVIWLHSEGKVSFSELRPPSWPVLFPWVTSYGLFHKSPCISHNTM